MTLLAGVETGHVVHFYDHSETLALAVADFLGAGLAEGGTALVVATPEHTAAVARILEAAGIDMAAARAAGQYVELDAATVLAEFMVEGSPDRALFESTVGPLLRTADAGIQPMRVYGEMVDLLWQQGNVAAAHDLEGHWNAIGAGRDFALFCGYFSALVDQAAARGDVADHHDAVLADHPFAVLDDTRHRFEPTLTAAGAARRFVDDVLRGWGHVALLPEAELVVSELATNAVVHTGQRFTVSLNRTGENRVRIAVTDASPATPTMRGSDPYATNGRGIRIVAAVAQEWGVDESPDGKTVWAVLAPRPGHS